MPNPLMQAFELHRADPLLILAVVIVAGVSFGAVAKFFRLPGVTGQVIAGIIIGEEGLNLFGDQSVRGLAPLTHFALGLIAFTVGAHLNIQRLRNAGKRLFILLLSESTVTPLLVFLSLWLLAGRASSEALLFATVAIATAPATIVAMVKETRSKGVFVKTLIAAVALNNMSCILLFEVARAFAAAGDGGDLALAHRLADPAAKLIAALAIGTLTGLAFELVARFTVRRDFLATAAVVALLAASGAADYFGASPLLACLLMGLVQTNLTAARDKHVDSAFEDFEPAIFAVFFTLAGMHLSLEHLGLVGLLVLLFVAARLAGKLLAADLAMRLAKATNQVRRNLGVALIPQAGVAVGLVILIQEDPDFQAIAGLFTAVVISAVAINEIVGPLLTRMALARSGEVNMDRSRLIDFLHEENIITGLQAADKPQAIEKLVDLLISSHRLKTVDRKAFLQSVLKREDEISTCLGGGLAIPHGELAASANMLGVMGLSSHGLPFETPDGRPVHCMVLLATPPDQRQRHLEVLAALARHIGTNPEVQRNLFNATSAAHAYDILHGEEAVDFNYFLESR